MKILPFTGVPIPLSAAIEIGDMVYFSGQVALRDGVIAGDTIEEQTGTIFDTVEQLLGQLGLELSNIIKATVWLTDQKLFAEFNAAYKARLKPPYPVRSTVISGLAMAGALIEIEFLASKEARRG